MDKRDELRLGFETAYIDGSVASFGKGWEITFY